MKTLSFAVALMTGAALVHAGEMKGMDMDHKTVKSDKSGTTHKAVGVVKKVDAKAGTVTIDHEPVKSMNWPKMTMAFQVKDKSMLDKLGEGKKIESSSRPAARTTSSPVRSRARISR